MAEIYIHPNAAGDTARNMAARAELRAHIGTDGRLRLLSPFPDRLRRVVAIRDTARSYDEWGFWRMAEFHLRKGDYAASRACVRRALAERREARK